MQHNEEKINEILFIEYPFDDKPLYPIEQAKQAMKAYGEHMYQKAIEDCIKCVPKLEKCDTYGSSEERERGSTQGFGDCRTQTITNLKALKNNHE